MDNFWGGVTLLSITAIGLLFYAGATLTTSPAEYEIRDLETECKEDKTTQNNFRLNYDNTITFTGQYPVQSPRSTLDIDYNHRNNHITLNIKTTREVPPATNYERDCDAYAVYHIKTTEMEGQKTVEIQNNGKTVKQQTFTIK